MITRRLIASEFTILMVTLVSIFNLMATVNSSALTQNNHQGTKQASGASSSVVTQQESHRVISYTNDQSKQQASPSGKHHNTEGTKQRSTNDDHDDMVPLATVNNHSRNNQNLLRPPQYVDVSALVGSGNVGATRNGNTSTSSGTGGGGGSGGTYAGNQAMVTSASGPMLNSQNTIPQANSLLTPKSRSGLPECATQQVCNAIFVRMNHTQRLCECSSNYNWKCSNNLDPQDGHTIELTRKFDKRIYTQIKTCEPLREVRACKSPTDWTLLALQSERSGKAHYVVVCKCPTWAQLEGPYTHNHPPYANIPGIRVYGMLCAHQTARSSSAQTYSAYNPALNIVPEFPWFDALNVLNTTNLANTLDGIPH